MVVVTFDESSSSAADPSFEPALNGNDAHQVFAETSERREAAAKPLDKSPSSTKVHLEIDDVETEWGFCLVAYFPKRSRGEQPLQLSYTSRSGQRRSVQSELHNSWKVPFEYHPGVNGWMVFRFENAEDRDKAVHGGPYSYSGHLLLLKAMPSWFRFGDDDRKTMPFWIQLPLLPLECWTGKALSKIVSMVGKPITIDKTTRTKERLHYARVLVEIDASKELVRSIDIVTPTGVEFKQPVVFETVPEYCAHCQLIGHMTDSCQPPQQQVESLQPLQQAVPVHKQQTMPTLQQAKETQQPAKYPVQQPVSQQPGQQVTEQPRGSKTVNVLEQPNQVSNEHLSDDPSEDDTDEPTRLTGVSDQVSDNSSDGDNTDYVTNSEVEKLKQISQPIEPLTSEEEPPVEEVASKKNMGEQQATRIVGHVRGGRGRYSRGRGYGRGRGYDRGH